VPSCCVNSHIILLKLFLFGGPSVKKQAPNRYQAVAELPKLLGPHAPVLVSQTSDGYACAPDNLTGSVRVPQGPRINHLQPGSQDYVNTNHTPTFCIGISLLQKVTSYNKFYTIFIRVIKKSFKEINFEML
jgi:hypothetical protein